MNRNEKWRWENARPGCYGCAARTAVVRAGLARTLEPFRCVRCFPRGRGKPHPWRVCSPGMVRAGLERTLEPFRRGRSFSRGRPNLGLAKAISGRVCSPNVFLPNEPKSFFNISDTTIESYINIFGFEKRKTNPNRTQMRPGGAGFNLTVQKASLITSPLQELGSPPKWEEILPMNLRIEPWNRIDDNA